MQHPAQSSNKESERCRPVYSISNLYAVSGGRETLYAELFQGKQGQAGGRLSATIRYSWHAMHLTGGITNAQSSCGRSGRRRPSQGIP
jgi:hypothetical protein